MSKCLFWVDSVDTERKNRVKILKKSLLFFKKQITIEGIEESKEKEKYGDYR